MNNNFKKTKILFSVVVLLMIMGIISGGSIIKNKTFFTKRQFSQTISYLDYKLSLNKADGKNLTASVISIFNDTGLIIEDNNDNAKLVPVLLYHGIIDEPDGSNVLLEDFRDQMFALKKAGWQTVGIEDFYAFMKGEKNLPDKSFLLTFDDGAKTSYYPVDPILKALDYRAVSFILPKYSIGNKSADGYYLSEYELKKMIKSGRWDLQSHGYDGHTPYTIDSFGTKGNFFSNKLLIEDKGGIETKEEFKTRVYDDFVNSKKSLETKFGIEVISFAYPLGDFGQSSINFPEAEFVILDTIKSIYSMSFYQVWGDYSKGNYPQVNAEHLFAKRINVEPEWKAENLLFVLENSIENQNNHYDLLTILQNSREKTLPYFDDFLKKKGWKKTWGNIDFKDQSVSMGSHASTTGSMVFLDGSHLWQNYVFKADVYFEKGQTYSIVAGYKDNSNYVFCSFTPLSVRLEQMVEGERKVLNEFKGKFDLLEKEKNIGIGFSGKDASCYLDNKRVIDTSDIDDRLDSGGIGFKTWDPQFNNSEMAIKNVYVEEIK